jgi:hypothetical protein
MCHNQRMKFKTGLVIGIGVGYVLGARAGRERYEQLKSVLDSVTSNRQVRKAAAVASKSTEGARNLAGTGLIAAGGKVRDAAEAERSNGNGFADPESITRRWKLRRLGTEAKEPVGV